MTQTCVWDLVFCWALAEGASKPLCQCGGILAATYLYVKKPKPKHAPSKGAIPANWQSCLQRESNR